MSVPAISAVVPTYNRPFETVRAVQSIFRQTLQPLEVIVVDDGSAERLDGCLAQFGSKLRYFWQPNAGPGAARNKAIRAAQGEWIAFLDSDDIWFPAKLEAQIAALREWNLGICFHDLVWRVDGEPARPSWNRHVSEGKPLTSGPLRSPYELAVFRAHAFLTSTLLIRKDILDAVGGMREDLPTNQDIELYLRLAARYAVGYLDEELAEYSPGPSRAMDAAMARTPRRDKREIVYRDRIRALRYSIADRIQVGDRQNARVARRGLQQATRSLAGVYRRSGDFLGAARGYGRCVVVGISPLRLLALPRSFR